MLLGCWLTAAHYGWPAQHTHLESPGAVCLQQLVYWCANVSHVDYLLRWQGVCWVRCQWGRARGDCPCTPQACSDWHSRGVLQPVLLLEPSGVPPCPPDRA
jgi:hypothetical protein